MTIKWTLMGRIQRKAKEGKPLKTDMRLQKTHDSNQTKSFKDEENSPRR